MVIKKKKAVVKVRATPAKKKTAPAPKKKKETKKTDSKVRTKTVPLRRFGLLMYVELDEDQIWPDGLPDDVDLLDDLKYTLNDQHLTIVKEWNLDQAGDDIFGVVEVRQQGEPKAGLEHLFTLEERMLRKLSDDDGIEPLCLSGDDDDDDA